MTLIILNLQTPASANKLEIDSSFPLLHYYSRSTRNFSIFTSPPNLKLNCYGWGHGFHWESLFAPFLEPVSSAHVVFLNLSACYIWPTWLWKPKVSGCPTTLKVTDLYTFLPRFFHCQWRCQPWGRRAVCVWTPQLGEGLWRGRRQGQSKYSLF